MKLNNKAEGMAIIIIAIIATAIIATVICFAVKSYYIDTYTITGTVSQKYLSPDNGGTTFVVKLTDGKKLEIKRNLWYGGSQYNEDDIYSSLTTNATYKFTCWGWQYDFWFIYWYPNVIKAEQV